MAEVTVSARVPKDIAKDIDKLMREEKLEKSACIRKLLAYALQKWRERKALLRLENGEISFTKAAELAGLSVWEFADLVKREGLVWLKSEKLKEDIQKALS